MAGERNRDDGRLVIGVLLALALIYAGWYLRGTTIPAPPAVPVGAEQEKDDFPPKPHFGPDIN